MDATFVLSIQNTWDQFLLKGNVKIFLKPLDSQILDQHKLSYGQNTDFDQS